MNDLTLTNTEFKALSSETRVHILKLLKERQHNLSELSRKLELKAPSVKQHLDQLTESGLIAISEEGKKWKYYALTRKGRKLVEPSEQTHIMVVLSVGSIALIGLLMLFYSAFFMTTQSAMMAKSVSQTASIGIAPSAPLQENSETTVQKESPSEAESSVIPYLGAGFILLAALMYWTSTRLANLAD